MTFNSNTFGNLTDKFLTETDLIDQYVGNKLWTWGQATDGVLGTNSTPTGILSPVQTIAGGTNWKTLAESASQFHAAAIKTDGTLWLWGRNWLGELGDGTRTSKSSPIQTIAGGTNWKQVCTGYKFTLAIKTDGTLWTWGRNTYGQLGDGTVVDKSSPIQTIASGTNWKQISSGYGHSFAIKTDGTLWGWGRNIYGELGDDSTDYKSSPVQTIAGGTNWKQISAGGYCTAAIKTDGTLWVWARNNVGQLGDGTTIDRSSPVQTITGGTNWKRVTVNDSLLAIKTDGTLWGSGYSIYLGDGTNVNKSSPVQTIAGGTNWKQVTIANYGAAAGIKTDGTLWTWGDNSRGALGDNTTVNKSSPVQTIAGGTNWKQVSNSALSIIAITYGD